MNSLSSLTYVPDRVYISTTGGIHMSPPKIAPMLIENYIYIIFISYDKIILGIYVYIRVF